MCIVVSGETINENARQNQISRNAARRLGTFRENRIARRAKWSKRITCCGRCILQLQQWIAFQSEDKLVSIAAFPAGWHYQIFPVRSNDPFFSLAPVALAVYRSIAGIETNGGSIGEILQWNVYCFLLFDSLQFDPLQFDSILIWSRVHQIFLTQLFRIKKTIRYFDSITSSVGFWNIPLCYKYVLS